MRIAKCFMILFALVIAMSGKAQTSDIDRLKSVLEKTGEDTSRISLLLTLGRHYEGTNLDSAVLLTHQAYELSKKINYASGEANCLRVLGELYMKKDNYFFGLQTEINALKLFEKLKDEKGIAETYYAMGNIYERVGDHHQALNNFNRSKNLALTLNDSTLLLHCYSSLGYNYYKLDNQDSAAKYAQIAYDFAMNRRNNNARLPWTIALMGVVQQEMGNPAIAMAYYYEAIAKAAIFDQKGLFPYVYQVMAELYQQTTLRDSAILYGEKALEASQKINFSKGIADASTFLANIYSEHDKNKAVDFFKLSEQLRDSIFSVQKMNQVQTIAYTEELRQYELHKQQLAEAEERKHNIQYAAIAIGVIIFVIMFLLLSHSIIVNAKVVGFFGVVALLIIFEFINLILHPYISKISNHSPALMLGCLVIVAALLVPAHHYLQKWINSKLVEKNNRIRLAAAKKIIAEFEKKNIT
ncbi:MAG TPA: tetratricopeptide repeat protein [Chitinophagaceae bacterium]|nr:tetratricopeptide repeat protein [Chitinophagaceae bacterium]